ncbi:hypothetical protein IFM89_015187, partial [Coptis chinensis]
MFAYTGGGDLLSILFQELKATAIRLSLCIAHDYKRIIVNSDSLRAIHILRDIDTSPWPCWNLVATIRKLLLCFNEVSLLHVFQEENRGADHLAKLSLGESMEHYVQEKFCGTDQLMESGNDSEEHKSWELIQDTIKNQDRISGLPDDVLFHILSLLEMKDVVKTGVLSRRRWEHRLWTNVRILDFCGPSSYEKEAQE